MAAESTVGRRWTVWTATILAIRVVAPIKRDSPELHAYIDRLQKGLSTVSNEVWLKGFTLAVQENIPDALKSSAAPVHLSKGRRHWTTGEILDAMHREHGSAPSRKTLLRALAILVRAGALRRLEDGHKYVFVLIPATTQLIGAMVRGGLRITKEEPSAERLAHVLRSIAR